MPAAPLPAYSASKAALNAFVLCLRAQLDKSSVKVIEISPPPVQSKMPRLKQIEVDEDPDVSNSRIA